LLSSSPDAYVDQRRQVQPFAYFWKTKGGLIDAFIRESAAYRSAVDGGAAPEAALAQLKSDREFMAKLRAEKTRLQAGLVAIDPATGEVKAWVGSRDFKTDQYDHVAQARRQPGSTFKAFVYGAALERGMSPDKRFTDRKVEISLPDGTVWRPSDLSEPSGRQMTAREGLIYSKNTITAQVMQEIGPRKTAELARQMGVNQSKLDEVPALALGTSPVTPLEMVSAYSTIAAGGEYRPPLLITRITDKNGNLLAEFETKNQRTLSDRTAENLLDMLRGVVNQGTGQAVRTQFGLRADVAGKTGTTQKNTDGWFILMHPRLVAGSWVGFNDPRITMRSNYWGEGAHNALLVVGDFFQRSLSSRLIDGSARFPFSKPPDSIWEPFLTIVKEWLLGDKPAPLPAPAPRRDAEREAPRPRPAQRENWEPFMDMLREWLFEEKAKPVPSAPQPPRRDAEREQPRPQPSQREKDRLEDERQRELERAREKERLLERIRERLEQRRLEREQEKERLLERLMEKQEQRDQETREKNRHDDMQERQ
jgi:penicillin-binding protein 1A